MDNKFDFSQQWLNKLRFIRNDGKLDMQLLNYNMFGNFTCCEVPIFNKPNWLVYLMIYTQVLDRPAV